MKRPWMPLYIADYLKRTTHLGALESGAYLHLIMNYWQDGGLPDEDRQLARIAKLTDREWKKSRPVLQAFFYDGWKHKRIDEELAHATDVSSKRAAAAATREASKRARDLDQTEHGDGSNDPSNDDTLHTTQRKKDAASAAYAFESGIIKLKDKDYQRWKASFSHIDLDAELVAITPWAEQQGKNWFHAVPNALRNKNQQAKERKESTAKGGGQKWLDGIEGVL